MARGCCLHSLLCAVCVRVCVCVLCVCAGVCACVSVCVAVCVHALRALGRCVSEGCWLALGLVFALGSANFGAPGKTGVVSG